MLILLIVLITVITGVLVTCRNRSEKAVLLNDAVILATSFAEAAAASPSTSDLADAVSAMDNTEGQHVRWETDHEKGICTLWTEAVLDPEDDSARRYIVKLTRAYRSGTTDKCLTSGDYASDIIDVFAAGDNSDPGISEIETAESPGSSSAENEAGGSGNLGEALYSLKTGTYFRGEAGS